MKNIVVYHADCIDGAASAWTIARHLDAQKQYANPHVVFIPYAHHAAADAEKKIREELVPETAIYFVDVAPEKAFLDDLAKTNIRGIHIYDHHKTAALRLEGYAPPKNAHAMIDIAIDSNQPSAAKMIWSNLFSDPPPDFLKVIDMMDGDARGLKTDEDFAAAALIDTQDIRTITKAFNSISYLSQLSFNDMVERGMPTLKDQKTRTDKLLANVLYADLQILPDAQVSSVPVVNGNVEHFGRLISDRLTALGKESGCGLALAWSMKKNGAVSVSLRSDGTPDVSKVAAHLQETTTATGGGHAGAAAIQFASLEEFSRHIRLKPRH